MQQSTASITCRAPVLNWENVLKRKTMIVNKHTKGLDFLMKKNKVTVVRGYGRLAGAAKDGVHTVELTGADGTKSELKAKQVILASGFGSEDDLRTEAGRSHSDEY